MKNVLLYSVFVFGFVTVSSAMAQQQEPSPSGLQCAATYLGVASAEALAVVPCFKCAGRRSAGDCLTCAGAVSATVIALYQAFNTCGFGPTPMNSEDVGQHKDDKGRKLPYNCSTSDKVKRVREVRSTRVCAGDTCWDEKVYVDYFVPAYNWRDQCGNTENDH